MSKSKYKEIIQIDPNISFEDAMKAIAEAPKEKVEEDVKKDEGKKALPPVKVKKLLPAPKKKK
jgi:hypothetical protein